MGIHSDRSQKFALACGAVFEAIHAGRLRAAILMEQMLFEVKDLSKRFGQIAALADVGFHVRAGEVLGLIGPNGAGKSTLFECLAGVLPSDSGAVHVEGRPVAARELHKILFYVPDGIAPWPRQSLAWALDFT